MMSELTFLPLNIKILGHQNTLINKLIPLHPNASVLLAKTNKSRKHHRDVLLRLPLQEAKPQMDRDLPPSLGVQCPWFLTLNWTT